MYRVRVCFPSLCQAGMAWRAPPGLEQYAGGSASAGDTDPAADVAAVLWSLADRAAEIQTPERPVPPFAPAADGTPATSNLPNTVERGHPQRALVWKEGGRRDPGIPLRAPATEIDPRTTAAPFCGNSESRRRVARAGFVWTGCPSMKEH